MKNNKNKLMSQNGDFYGGFKSIIYVSLHYQRKLIYTSSNQTYFYTRMKKSKVSIKPLTVKSLAIIKPMFSTNKGNNGGYTWVG
jgi:hypothetical protein